MSEEKRGPAARFSGVHLVNIKNKRKARERLRYSFQRIDAQLTYAKNSRQIIVSMLLADISVTGASFFCAEQPDRGTQLELMILEPKVLRLKGAVVWSTPAITRLDSSQMRYPFRVGVRFIFGTEAERAAVREFCSKLKENTLDSHARQQAAVPANFVGSTAGSGQAATPPPATTPAALESATTPSPEVIAPVASADGAITPGATASAPAGETAPSPEVAATESGSAPATDTSAAATNADPAPSATVSEIKPQAPQSDDGNQAPPSSAAA